VNPKGHPAQLESQVKMNVKRKEKDGFGYSFLKYALAYHCVQPKDVSELMLRLDS
jgi:hypothetical protein